jgi:hypothetical protein
MTNNEAFVQNVSTRSDGITEEEHAKVQAIARAQNVVAMDERVIFMKDTRLHNDCDGGQCCACDWDRVQEKLNAAADLLEGAIRSQINDK